MIGTAVITFLAGLIGVKTVVKIARFPETIRRIGVGTGMALFGCIAARIHLRLFDRWYLAAGRVDRLFRP